jgi:hypothetical protein
MGEVVNLEDWKDAHVPRDPMLSAATWERLLALCRVYRAARRMANARQLELSFVDLPNEEIRLVSRQTD